MHNCTICTIVSNSVVFFSAYLHMQHWNVEFYPYQLHSWQSISCSKPFAGLWCLASLYAVQKTRAVLAICSDWLLTIASTMMSSFAYQEFLLLLNEPWSGHVKNFILFFLSARSCFLMSEADEVTVHVTHSFDSFIPLCLFWP